MNELATQVYDENNLTIDLIRNVISSGDIKPSEKDCKMLIAMCQAHHLNPFIGEIYMIINKKGKASIITSIAALEKRASSSPQFDGCTHGIIVKRGKDIVYQDGSFKLKDDVILGGWAKAYRKDQAHTQLTTVSFDEYVGYGIWATKPGVMIEKCAEAQALRKTFINETSGMYTSEEMNVDEPKEVEYVVEPVKTIEPAAIEPEEVKPERDPALDPIRALIKPFAAASKLSIEDAINMICSAQNVTDMAELSGKMIDETVEYMNATINAVSKEELAANDIEF